MSRLPQNEMPVIIFMAVAAIGAGVLFYFQFFKSPIESTTQTPINSEATSIEISKISAEEAKRIVDSGKAQIIDIRDANSYTDVHIKNAISIPQDTLESNIFKINAMKEAIILYGENSDDTRTTKAAEFLIKRGFPNIKILENGLAGWRNAEYEIKRGK